MAENSGFFEAQWDETIDNGDGTYGNWDRRYLSENFAQYFKNFVGNGVFASPTDQLKVSPAPSGLAVVVSAGWAFINGYWYHNDAAKTIEVPANSGSTSRIDSIKVRLNLSNRITTVDIYTGTTAVVRNDTYYDLKLAEIVVPAYATSIDAANVTDTRPNEAVCGFVKGLVEVVSTADLFAQYTAIFNEWFDGVKDQVTGDLAIRLQLEFTELNGNVEAYQRSVEADVDAAEALIQGYVYNDYITNELSFTFVNNRCEIADTRVTPNSLLDVYFTSDTIDEAENCEINIESGNQKYILTCVKTPSITIRGRIRVRVNSAIPVLPPEFDEYAPKDWVNSNFLSEESIRELSDDIETNTSGFETINGGLLQSCVVELEPIQGGEGDPSPTNIRPITGHSSVDVRNVGKNRLPMTVASFKAKNTSGIWNGNAYTVNGVTFTLQTDSNNNIIGIKVNGTASGNANLELAVFPIKNENYIINGCPSGSSSGNNFFVALGDGGSQRVATDLGDGASFTVSNGQLTFLIRIMSGYNAQNIMFYPMIRLATETDATFAPYLGKTYTISLGQTVYGCKFDAVSGKLIVDRRYLLADGVNVKCTGGYGGGTERLPAINISSAKGMSNNNLIGSYLVYNTNVELENNRNTMAIFSNGEYIALHINDIRGVGSGTPYADNSELYAAANTYLQSNNLQICYELATPIIIQLTPQQINTLIGENYIDVPLQGQTLNKYVYRKMFAWDDVNDVVKAVDDKNADVSAIGTDESGRTTASRSYIQGEHFYKDGKFGKTKTAVAEGATWTLNTNYEEGTVADAVRIKTAEFTETTSANGTFSSTLPSTAKVMSAYCTNASTYYVVIPLINQYAPNYWSFHIREAHANFSVVANTSVTIKVNYMD